jgi:hypothetical protein
MYWSEPTNFSHFATSQLNSVDAALMFISPVTKEDAHAFKNVLLAFQRHLPVEEMPDLVSQWQTYYTYTAGCIGLLKDWFMRALAEAVETGEKTISPALLESHAPSPTRCDQMITEIEEGEGHFKQDEGAEDRLRSRLGLEPRGESRASQQKERGQPSGSSVGQRRASRDPLKGGAEIRE